MSLASRAPLPPSSVPASWPRLVDKTGRVDVAAIRRELRTRWTGAGACSHGAALAHLMAKVRLQRKWALDNIATDARVAARVAADHAALEAEAQAMAAQHDFDPNSLSHARNRWAYGSLADTWPAAGKRRMYARAIEIAQAHIGAPAMAAE